MKILVTGAAGFIGFHLTARLANDGHSVVALDNLNDYYAVSLKGARLERLVDVPFHTIDIADLKALDELFARERFTHVVHLAAQAGVRHSVDHPHEYGLSNLTGFLNILDVCNRFKVEHFLYASSSSVYGVSDAPEVTEDHPLVPLTLYNRFKGECEPILFQHQSPDFTCVTIRPATVCGYAPRCRLDLTVNILTNHAITNGKITVFGGEQKRPNLHVEDMCDVYEVMLDAPAENIAGEIFNIGYENFTVMEIAQFVQGVVSEEFPELGKVDIVVTESDDKRSYQINSDKIKRVLGFVPKRNIEDAARSICAAFKDGRLPDSMTNDNYFNVRKMKTLKVA